MHDKTDNKNIQVRLNGSCSRTQLGIVELTLIGKEMATVTTDKGQTYCHEVSETTVRTDDGELLVRSPLDGIYRRP